jgi:hypothetical protein
MGVIISYCAVIGHFCAAVFGGDFGLFLVYFMDEARWFSGAPIIPRTTFSDDQKMHLIDINVGVWHTITERRINGPLQIIQLMCYAPFLSANCGPFIHPFRLHTTLMYNLV